MTTKSKAQDKHKMSEIDENISKLFDIKKRLGKGAYGIVWKALDKRNNETIAVKKIFDAFRDETDAQRTFREIIFLKAFRNHPNIVKLHNVFKAANNLDIYLIFEYMESDLHNIIKKGTILKDIHKQYVMYQLINAIKYIHSGNVIHRDLKPSNVLIDSKCRCKLADFGLARSVSIRPIGGGDNELNSELPLLTDYVATRWYRAPEILVASKRYTKGIDMWSLGCILGEMIRGKPLFQGSSTVNQIEKIVCTLPDITEHDIKAVGAGFGSVLLNKQISREKKTSINDLLSDAPKDALDLVKSLLVLDPLGRLTAKQAINHAYVEKFRNSIPEIELSVDVLPPFRDDVRLTVPEYRSKLYEIVQVGGEKKQTDFTAKGVVNGNKQRENKEKTDFKKPSKQKHNHQHHTCTDDKYKSSSKCETNEADIQHSQGETSTTSIVHKVQTKSTTTTSPLIKRKHNRILKNTISGEVIDQKYDHRLEERHIQRSKSQGHHHNQARSNHLTDNTEELSVDNVKRHSIANSNLAGHSLNSSSLKRLTNSQRHLRSSTTLSKLENEDKHNIAETSLSSTSPSFLRQVKSEIYSANKSPSSKKSQMEERICYERRLKKLEEEIERYKNEVKTFCRDTFNHSRHKQLLPTTEDTNSSKPHAEQTHIFKTSPKKMMNPNTPVKNTYLQLLAKGHRHDANKSHHDLVNGGSSDHFIHADNTYSFSGRSHEISKYAYNNNSLQRMQQEQQQNRQLQKQPRSRPLSKFI